jgi:anthranilate synthase component 1
MKLKEFPSREQFDLARTCNVIPVCREILADMETPVSLLKKCYDDNGPEGPRTPVFLLESVEGGEKWGRYSFLGTSARTHVKVFADGVTIAENGKMRKPSPQRRSPGHSEILHEPLPAGGNGGAAPVLGRAGRLSHL